MSDRESKIHPGSKNLTELVPPENKKIKNKNKINFEMGLRIGSFDFCLLGGNQN